jgi:hypothetical protein
MQNVFIEATNGPQNWGKFMVARFDEEWKRMSEVLQEEMLPIMKLAAERVGMPPQVPLRVPPLLHGIGWSAGDIIVFDLQTCEGAAFSPGGSAHYDLMKHKVWVCPLFEPFLTWLYKQDLSDLAKLPKRIDLPDAEFALFGYRREGKG